MAELQDGPPYACKLLRPSNGKNPEEPKNNKYPPMTYTFDVSKCDEIFELLVADGIILVPKNLKMPPLEQRKKRGFCKFHGFLGHNLSRCTCFRDSVQKALDEGRLKFGDKTKQPMQVDADPMKKVDSMYAEIVDVNMVNVSEVVSTGIPTGTTLPEVNAPGDAEIAAENHPFENAVVTEDQLAEKMTAAYPKAEEDLIDFLNRCKISSTSVMLCPRCSTVFDKEAAKSVEGFHPKPKRKGGWADNRRKFGFNKRGVPYRIHSTERDTDRNQRKTFNPPVRSPTDTWVFSGGKKSGHSAPPTKWVKRVAIIPNKKEASNSNRYAYNNNYKGKHPITKTQWCIYQRQKKGGVSKGATEAGQAKGKQVAVFEMVKKPATERIFPPLPSIVKDLPKEDEEMTSNFSDSEPSLDIVCNVVSILPVEYDVISEVNDVEIDFTEEMANHKPLCYCVMNDGCVESQHAIFEKPDHIMNHHLKPLFIQAKINGVGVNKVLVDSDATVNLLPQSLLGKIGLVDYDLKPHNVVLTNYEGTTGNSLGAVEVELIVGSVSRTTMFMEVPSKANFNVLLGRDWIHGVGAVPSTLH